MTRQEGSPEPLDTGTPNAERRREDRKPASGEVVARLDYGTRVIRGELVDVSPGGFRMRHPGAILKTGTEADITYSWGNVKARIMWVRQEGNVCDAGFLIVG